MHLNEAALWYLNSSINRLINLWLFSGLFDLWTYALLLCFVFFPCGCREWPLPARTPLRPPGCSFCSVSKLSLCLVPGWLTPALLCSAWPLFHDWPGSGACSSRRCRARAAGAPTGLVVCPGPPSPSASLYLPASVARWSAKVVARSRKFERWPAPAFKSPPRCCPTQLKGLSPFREPARLSHSASITSAASCLRWSSLPTTSTSTLDIITRLKISITNRTSYLKWLKFY